MELVEQTRKGMGTHLGLHLAVAPEDLAPAQRAMAACFAWLAEVETALTRFDDTSELCRLNAASGEWRAVSETLFAVTEQAVNAARASSGLFDPTMLPTLVSLGYDRDFPLIAWRETFPRDGAAADDERPQERRGGASASVRRSGAWRSIRLDRARQRIFLPPGVKIDLGGIAKGWAADEALERFFADHPNVIVDLGGDMRLRGEKAEGEPWPIGVGEPRRIAGQGEPEQAVISLRRGAIATSGATNRWWYHDGQLQHHLLDPRTGQAARLWISVSDHDAMSEPRTLISTATALAPTAAHAEIAAKVALLRGYPQALRSVESAWVAWQTLAGDARQPTPYTDEGVALILTMGSGEVVASSNLRAYVDTLGGGGDLWLS